MANLRYLALGVVRRLIPHSALYWVMRRRGDASMMEASPQHGVQLMCARLAQLGRGVAGAHILDLGSGRYARGGLAWLAAGARRVTLVDFDATALDDPEHRALLLRDCATLGLDPADALGRLRLVSGDFMQVAPPTGDDCPDLIISTSVLEHVRDPAAILARCYAWLRPGGATLHVVDLRDHNLQFRHPFEMLAYSDATWRRWIDLGGGFHLNRWRAPDYQRALAQAGYSACQIEPVERDLAGARAIRPRLSERYRAMSDEDLAIQVIAISGQRDACGS